MALISTCQGVTRSLYTLVSQCIHMDTSYIPSARYENDLTLRP